MARNLRLVRTVRESAGPDVDIMFDAWMSWDVPYTIRMAERMEEYLPRWIEEPVLPDKIEQYAEIRRNSRIPISGGEHEYTRWGLKQLMDAGACDVLQPDIYWAGGISEMMKIGALASAYDLPVIPHGHSTTGQRPLHRSMAADDLPAAGVSGQVERDSPVLPQDSAQASQRRDHIDGHAWPWAWNWTTPRSRCARSLRSETVHEAQTVA